MRVTAACLCLIAGALGTAPAVASACHPPRQGDDADGDDDEAPGAADYQGGATACLPDNDLLVKLPPGGPWTVQPFFGADRVQLRDAADMLAQSRTVYITFGSDDGVHRKSCDSWKAGRDAHDMEQLGMKQLGYQPSEPYWPPDLRLGLFVEVKTTRAPPELYATGCLETPKGPLLVHIVYNCGDCTHWIPGTIDSANAANAAALVKAVADTVHASTGVAIGESHPPVKDSPSSTVAPPGLGTLRVVSDPAGAVVLIDGNDAGRTPLTLQLPAGDREVIIDLAGYAAKGRLVNIAAGQWHVYNESLERQPAEGVPRSTWISRLELQLGPVVCDTAYFKTCFDATLATCLQAATAPSFACMREIVSSLPNTFNEEKGREWGARVGSCVGTRLEQALLATRKALPECNDPDHWK